MNSLPDSIAYVSSRAFARYCLWATHTATVAIEGEANFPVVPAVLAGWHTGNLLALALHYHYFRPLPAVTFAPPGFVGTAARGEMDGFGLRTIALPAEATGNPLGALRHMIRALAAGELAVIAVDGPYGPAFRVQPGALWLARATGRPLIPIGFAARPAVRWPRWDRQIIPLPGARVAAVIGPPIVVEQRRPIDAARRAALGEAIGNVTRRAWELAGSPAVFDQARALTRRPPATRLAAPEGLTR